MVCMIWGCQRGQTQPVQLVRAFPQLRFDQPVFLTHAGDGSDRVFVLQQNGLMKVFPNDSLAVSAKTFLDLSARLSSPGGEEGLLGLAFHPQYSTNGFFYVNYTAPQPLRTVISRFRVSASDPDVADPLSEYPILEILQPYSNHNGGMIAFGPDGYLYIGMGDGGSGGDPQGNAQNLSVLLGKMLRIDVDDTSATARYRIPPDNPFAGNTNGYRQEIWAYGLRNPWRFSFDRPTGQLWAGDVGQNSREEIDLIVKGRNYGWRIMEGSSCYNPPSGCDQTNLTLPVKDYGRLFGYSVTGGMIYRGSRRPDLVGAYVYGDFGSGNIWMFRHNGLSLSADSLLLRAPFNISSFGMDEADELYVVSYSAGEIYRFSGNSVVDTGGSGRYDGPGSLHLEQNFPNPFNPMTQIRYTIPDAGVLPETPRRVTLEVYDVLGRMVTLLVDEMQSAGEHATQFDAEGLAGGVYLLRLTSGGAAAVRKMVCVR